MTLKPIRICGLAAIVTSLLASGCSSLPPITDVDVSKAFNSGTLEQLYERIEKDLHQLQAKEKSDSDVAENHRHYLAVVARRMASQQEQSIRNNDLDKNLDGEFDEELTLHDYQQALLKATELEKYDPDIAAILMKEIQAQIYRLQTLIDEKQKSFNNASEIYTQYKINLLDEIVQLSGNSNQGLKAQEQRVQFLESLYEKAKVEMASKTLEETRKTIDQLKLLAPDLIDIIKAKKQPLINTYEKAYWQQVDSETYDDAFVSFRHLMDVPDYLDNNIAMKNPLEKMVKAFVIKADSMMEEEQYSLAQRYYARAAFINRYLEKVALNSRYIPDLVEKLSEKLLLNYNNNQVSLSYACLLAIETIIPNYEMVNRYKKTVTEQILNSTAIDILLNVKSGHSNKASITETFDNLLVDQLRSRYGNLLQVYDGSNYSSGDFNGSNSNRALYQLDALIEEVNINTSEQKDVIEKTIITGYSKGVNPAHEAWSKLSPNQKKRAFEPPLIADIANKESITINRNTIEKNAIFTTQIHLTDLSQGDSIFKDSFSTSDTMKGEQIKGLVKGNFKQESVEPDFPSDDDILQELAATNAEFIAIAMNTPISTLKNTWLEQGNKAFDKGDLKNAVNYFVYYHVLSAKQGKSTEALTEKLIHTALQMD